MKKFLIKAHMHGFCSTTHFAQCVEAENIFAAKKIFTETYGLDSCIDIIQEVTK